MAKERSSLYHDNGRQGFVYVLSSLYMHTEDGIPLVKVGATRKHPLQRARELAAGTGVPDSFKLSYYRDFADSFLAETLVHDHFAAARVNEGREFFAIPLDEVIAFVDSLPTRADYQEGLSSEGVTGGENERAPVVMPSTPWAELFASFPDDGSPRELTEEEQARCRALQTRSRA